MDTNLCGCDMCSQVGHNEKHSTAYNYFFSYCLTNHAFSA